MTEQTAESKIPSELTRLPQWLCWRKELDEKGKPTKVPSSARSRDKLVAGSSTDPHTWGTYDAAVGITNKFGLNGVGFAISESDGLSLIDLDHCRDPETGIIALWAQEIIRALNSYSEISPSLTGVHVWLFGKLAPGSRCKKKYETGNIEMYSRDRYATVTGVHLEGTPTAIEERQKELDALYAKVFQHCNGSDTRRKAKTADRSLDDEALLDKIRASKQGPEFSRLWAGDASSYGDDDSSADLALCNILAFWCGPDASRIDLLFRRSGLMREKWDRRWGDSTYGARTIEKALENKTEFYGHRNGDRRSESDRSANSTSARPTNYASGSNSRGPVPNLLFYLANDHGNAERLIALHGHNLRYCHDFKKWLVWDGRRWAVDDTDQATHLAKLTMLELLRQSVEAKDKEAERFALSSLDARDIHRMLSLAQCEIYVRVSELDTNPYLLNVLNGTVDLRTKELHPHQSADFITKLVKYNYQPDAQCPRWRSFLDEIMGSSPDASEGALERAERFINYLQRSFGYSLTGVTSEKAVFIPFGDGDNGKSTMLDTIRKIVDEYAAFLQVETLMTVQENSNSQADLADLRGARFVQTSETEKGQHLSQAKIKRITQGVGKIKATRKYENPITFPETHKLWIDTNRKPGIRDDDDKATFSRLHPIPFTVCVPKDQIDKELPTKLLAEAEGILAWAVEGAFEWHRVGLRKPHEVQAANERWRSESDQLQRFMDECCVIDESAYALATPLFEAYTLWCDKNRERTISSKDFSEKLQKRGFVKHHTKRGSRYQGVGLKDSSAEEEGDR
jgi:putative DNA primase/helicase